MSPPMTSSTPYSPANPSRRGRRRRWIPYLLGGVLLGFIVISLWPKPIHVQTAPVHRGPLTVSVLEEGKTRSRHRHAISAPIPGFLDRVELRPGDPIKAGQTVLATVRAESSGFLDPRTRAEAEARIQGAEAAKLSRQAGVERSQVALDLARKELERAEILRQTGVISTQEWEATDNRVQLLTRDLRVAEFSLRVAEFEVAQARAALLQGRSPEREKEPLAILAPVDGYVLHVYEESARVVTSGLPLMEVGDLSDLEAEIELLSSDAVAVAPGAAVSIENWGGAKPLRGRVSVVERGGFTKISALGVEEQRVKVRVEFLDSPPPGQELGDRFRVEARIVTWHGDNVLQIPAGALFRRGSHWMVFALAEGKARLRQVEIGHNNGLAAEVLSGLVQGERVVLFPPDRLKDASSVSFSPGGE